MGDETGVQASLYLLLILSDDEIGDQHTSPSKKVLTSSIIAQIKVGLKPSNSVNSLNSRQKGVVNQSKSWFFRNTNNLLDFISQVLNDSYMQRNSKRVAIILLSNLHLINLKQAKLFTKKKSTYELLSQFLECDCQDMQEEELRELERAFLVFYTLLEVKNILKSSSISKFDLNYNIQGAGTGNIGTGKGSKQSDGGEVQFEIEHSNNFKGIQDQFLVLKEGDDRMVSSQLIRSHDKYLDKIKRQVSGEAPNDLNSDASSEFPNSFKQNQIRRVSQAKGQKISHSPLLNSSMKFTSQEGTDSKNLPRQKKPNNNNGPNNQLLQPINKPSMWTEPRSPTSQEIKMGENQPSSYNSGTNSQFLYKKQNNAPSSYDNKNSPIDTTFLGIRESHFISGKMQHEDKNTPSDQRLGENWLYKFDPNTSQKQKDSEKSQVNKLEYNKLEITATFRDSHVKDYQQQLSIIKEDNNNFKSNVKSTGLQQTNSYQLQEQAQDGCCGIFRRNQSRKQRSGSTGQFSQEINNSKKNLNNQQSQCFIF